VSLRIVVLKRMSLSVAAMKSFSDILFNTTILSDIGILSNATYSSLFNTTVVLKSRRVYH